MGTYYIPYVIVLLCRLHKCSCLCMHMCMWVHLSVYINILHHLRYVRSRFSGELEINHPNPYWHHNAWSTNQQLSQINVNGQQDGQYVGFNHYRWCLILCVCLTGIWAVEGGDKEMEEDEVTCRGEKGRYNQNKSLYNTSFILFPLFLSSDSWGMSSLKNTDEACFWPQTTLTPIYCTHLWWKNI